MIRKELDEAIAEREDEIVEFRRDLHQHPELSHAEFETTRKIVARVTDMGLEVHARPEGLGLYADLAPDGFDPARHRTVAVRADIDALPIAELTGLPYASTNPGVMHACGHDVHSACALGAAMGLARVRLVLPGRVRFLFQHSEEVAPGGAEDLVNFGCMEGVHAVVGLHVDPGREVGTVGVKAGPLTAAADAFELTIRGKGGHAARPHNTVDPVFVATQVCAAIYQSVGRVFDAREPVVITVASVAAGEGFNVIPDTAVLRGTARTLSPGARCQIEPLLRRIADGICKMNGAEYSLEINLGAPPISNDESVDAALRDAAASVLGEDAVHEIALPSMGAEDFSFYLQEAPGAMFRLGVGTPGVAPQYLHTPTVAPDERAIVIGARILARAAVTLLADP
jgi:amidohydrolase